MTEGTARLSQGIWPAIRPRPIVDSEAEFRATHRAWASRIASRLPDSLHSRILSGWDDRYGIRADERNGSVVWRANVFAAETVRDFGDARAGLAYDESAISTHAENYAGMCARMKSRARRAKFARWFGIDPPEGPRITDEGACARMDDPLWWRRQLRKVWTRRSEDAMRRAGVIRKGRAPYASEEAVRHKRARNLRTREWMESRVMVNGEGEQLELVKLADKSLANPALRRGEFMCRMRGFEEIATDLEHVALFFTLTAPSTFHAQLSSGGINPRYRRQTVRDAQQWLCKQWARARAKLARLSISFYGFRVAEPHHDATPHWHMVLFVSSHNAQSLRDVVRLVWLREYSDEPGALEHRCKVVPIDRDAGSATGYIAKYVAKNIDGAGGIGDEISDETGERVSDSVARVAAWASTHGVRQFQQIGGPPVGLWRECRRVRDVVESGDIERARAAADAGHWRDFVSALGGIERARRRVRCVASKYARECDVTPETAGEFPAAWIERAEPRAVDPAGREVLALTRYGEAPALRAVGVVSFGLLGRWASMRTRRHRWRIEKKMGQGNSSRCDRTAGVAAGPVLNSPLRSFSALGPVAITVRGEFCGPWEREFAWISTIPFRETRAGPS